MNGILDALAEIMRDNLWAAPLLSLLAGIITSFTPPVRWQQFPCCLPVWVHQRQVRKKLFAFLLRWRLEWLSPLGFSDLWRL